MSIYSDLLQYYQNNPLADINEDVLPNYLVMVEKTLQNTLIEYSKYKPIYEIKTVIPLTDKIDIYQDIHPYLLDIIYFGEKRNISSELNNIFYQSGYKYPFNKNYSSQYSLLSLISNFEYLQILRDYFSIKKERMIVSGKYIIGLKPNIEYDILYTRLRTQDEITLMEKDDFEKLFVLNLLNEIYSNTKFMGETALRSVSISGMSISFGFPSVEQQKKHIQKEKNNLIKKISGEEGYLPEVF